jgi:dTMP kinase
MKLFNGYFITVEGGEGSGKSTLLDFLGDLLVNHGFSVVKTREPGGTRLGEKIRNLLLNCDEDTRISSQAELLLFLAARAQHIEELIKPALIGGKIVLCDRFNDSTIAYQGAARGLEAKYVKKLCQLICGSVIPQLTLFLDVDPEIGLVRTHKLEKEDAAAGQFDRIEKEALDFHKRVQNAFRRLAKREPLRIYHIDANQSQEYVKNEAIRAINELILLPSNKERI